MCISLPTAMVLALPVPPLPITKNFTMSHLSAELCMFSTSNILKSVSSLSWIFLSQVRQQYYCRLLYLYIVYRNETPVKRCNWYRYDGLAAYLDNSSGYSAHRHPGWTVPVWRGCWQGVHTLGHLLPVSDQSTHQTIHLTSPLSCNRDLYIVIAESVNGFGGDTYICFELCNAYFLGHNHVFCSAGRWFWWFCSLSFWWIFWYHSRPA